MMDETYIMNHVKEQCCFVSSDPLRDLAAAQYARWVPVAVRLAVNPKHRRHSETVCDGCRNGSTEFMREYVLPDQVEHKIGYIRVRPAALILATRRRSLSPGMLPLFFLHRRFRARRSGSRTSRYAGLASPDDFLSSWLANRRSIDSARMVGHDRRSS